MSDRILRDELLTSERYWAISNDAKLLYIHLILNVDDTARFSGKNFTLRASCFPGQPMDAVHMERMLDELLAQDLIRMYVVENERFIFVPRFKQRLRFIHSRFPEPPNEINDLVIKKSDLSQSQVSLESDHRPPKLSEVKRSKVKRSEEKSIVRKSDLVGFETFWNMYPKKVGKKAAQNAWNKIDAPITTLDLIREALEWQQLSDQWTKDNGQYIPNPQTYLNQGRWLDQKIEPTGNQSLTKLGQRAEMAASRWLNNFENNGELL